MESLRVERVSKKMIKPSIPTPKHLQNLHISLFDQLAPPMYVHILFYYLSHQDSSEKSCTQIEKSLSRALTRFYPLAGRFVSDDLLIRWADQGVDFFEATSVDGAKLQDLIKKRELEEVDQDVLSRFLPWDHPPPANSATSPLLAVQITTFGCGGFVLGLQISHVIADAFSLMEFVKEWASISNTNTSRFSEASFPSYSNGIASIFPTMALPSTEFLPRPALNSARLVTARFLFDETVISNFGPKSGSSSRVVVVLALIWKALNSVSMAKHNRYRGSILALPMSLRGRCKADLPDSELCFGNFWIPVLVRAIAFEMEELMILLQDTITSNTEKIAVASAEEISGLLVNSKMAMLEEISINNVDVFVCTTWCRLDIYEVDFGWGKPSWVSHANKIEGIVLMDAKSGTGIEACVCLNERDMTLFTSQLQAII